MGHLGGREAVTCALASAAVLVVLGGMWAAIIFGAWLGVGLLVQVATVASGALGRAGAEVVAGSGWTVAALVRL